jgi:uncharacterized repeat protein (TIGR03803 family)
MNKSLENKLSIKALFAFILFAFPCISYSQSGYLYGTAYIGGKHGYGVLFKYNIATKKDTVVLNFDSTNTGAFPLSAVILASNGLIYGNTYEGGKYGYGTIFSYNPITGKDSVWKNFDYVNDGAYPIGGLMQSKSGLIYGTTPEGVKRFGTLFSLNISTGQFAVDYVFDSVHGSFPWDAPYESSAGLLYGTTNSGGKYNDGVIFCYNPKTGKDTTCFSFDDSLHGQNPDCSLCLASDSLLYGMTNSGGSLGYGVLFGFNPKNYQCKNAVNFNDTDGAYAFSNLIEGTDGKLYGMTEGGGIAGAGVVLSYKPGDSIDNVCVDLTEATGANSFGSVIQAPDGLLYGTTAYGGSKDSGVIFNYDPVAHIYTKLMDFNSWSGTGFYPNASLLYVSDTVLGIKELTAEMDKVNIFPNPSHGEFTLKLSGVNQSALVEVYNIMGEEITSIPLNPSIGGISITNILLFQGQNKSMPGIYPFKIITASGAFIGEGKLVVE